MRPELRGPQAPPAPGGSCAPAGVPRGPRLWAVATAMRLPRARPSLGPPPLLEPLSTPAQASFTDGQTDTGGALAPPVTWQRGPDPRSPGQAAPFLTGQLVPALGSPPGPAPSSFWGAPPIRVDKAGILSWARALGLSRGPQGPQPR